MQIGSRIAAWFGGKKPTAKDYVQDGLIAMWDGVENAGWGEHSKTVTAWKDLIGVADLTAQNQSHLFTEDGCNLDGNCWFIGNASNTIKQAFDVSHDFTVEVGIMPDGDLLANTIYSAFCCSTSSSSRWLKIEKPVVTGTQTNNFGWGVGAGFATVTNSVPLGRKFTTAVVRKDGDFYEYINGAYTRMIKSGLTQSVCGNTIGIGYDVRAKNYPFKGKICFVRISDIAIDEAILAANYAIDKARFGLP